MNRWSALVLIVFALIATSAQASAPTDIPHHEVVLGSGGVPLVVQEWGNPDGPPVVLIHGFSFGSVVWKHQIGAIAREARIIAFDLRGHGLSGKPWNKRAYAGSEVWAKDVAAVLAAKGIKRPLIVGWSFGGYVAIDYLRSCGSNCASGLVLVSSLAGLVENAPQPDPKEAGIPPNAGDVRVDDYHSLYDGIAWTAAVMTAGPLSSQAERQKELVLAMTPPYVRRAMVDMRLDNEDFPGRLNLPVLLIHGGQDASIPRYKIDELLAVLPNATAETYETSGHSPFEEQPERFNRDILDFVRAIAHR